MKNSNRITTADLTMMALLAALLSAASYIFIPLPFSSASITANTLVVNMIGLILEPMQAVLTVGVWMLLGLVGVPVYTGGASGPGKLFGPSGGYYFSWLLAAALISLLKGKKHSIRRYNLVTILVGIPVIYLGGSIWMGFVAGIDDIKTLIVASILPFIPGDIVKCLAATYISVPVLRALESMGVNKKRGQVV